MQHPLLYLGLIGFEPEEELRVRHWLEINAQQASETVSQDQSRYPIWRVVDFQEADALLICGAGVQQGGPHSLQFKASARKPSSPIGLQLDELKLPYALSHLPQLQAMGVRTEHVPEFDARQDASLLKTIQYFETALRPLRSLFALALELTQRQNELDGDHTFHLERNGSLQVIVDAPARRVLLHPGVRPVDIGADAWMRRPRSANFAPAHFLQCSLEEITWLFGMHCPLVDLPERYAQKTIHLRRNPRVRSSLLYPRHATLLDRLSLAPPTLAQLRQDLPTHQPWLERDLFALYLTRAISTATAPDGQTQSLNTRDFDTTGKWTLDRLSRRANTVAGDLNPLF
ncbi:MAG: hypothetical protein ACKO1L_05530 [Brachymonas sp.]